MQKIYNYGSLLQAYGLKSIVEMIDSSLEVKFIDYRPGKPLEDIPNETNSKVMRTFNKVKQYSKGNAGVVSKVKFINHKRTYAKRNYPILGVTEQPDYNTNVDIQIIGSDEVFNCVQGNINVGYSKDLFGFNSNAEKVISYAGSFGNTTLDKLIKKNIDSEISKYFNDFNDISVRDENSASIIEALTNKRPKINVDPVLAYDYMSLESSIPKERQFEEKYIVVYGYSGRFTDEENRLVKEYAKTNNYKILCFGGVQDCCDVFIDCSPFEVLAYFRDAEAIVTDTFHGSIFSLINEKQFCTILRTSKEIGYGNEEKLSYLLKLFGLENQIAISGQNIDIEEKLNSEIDYEIVQKKLKVERKKSFDYLKSNII